VKRFLVWLRSLAGGAARRVRRAASDRYWRRRARRHGRRSIFNLGHGAEQLEAVTRRQMEVLFPLLEAELDGGEALAVDFGCGTGRFTPGLARRVGRAIGVDPIQELLDLAPAAEGVEYRRLRGTAIPVEDASADVVWICLVLGVLTDAASLEATASEIRRVLRPGGLIFLVENTEERPALPHYVYRSPGEYAALFPDAGMHEVGAYEDLGERITVLAGRTRAA
jgi:SAM-dependent methyltransferase